MSPESGTVRHGINLEISYFDQTREQLDPEKTVAQNVADGKDYVDTQIPAAAHHRISQGFSVFRTVPAVR
ncbi:MAG: hypothetical protein R2861_02190 [Desulfobacterales bacterium]